MEEQIIEYVNQHPEFLNKLLTKKRCLDTLCSMDEQTLSEKFNLFPVRDEVSWYFYNAQESNLWNAKEIDVLKDAKEFYELPESYQRLFKLIFGFFAPADGLVSEAITLRYINEATSYHEKNFLYIQAFIERVHAETYGQFIYSILKDGEIDEIINYIDTLPAMKAKGKFIEDYIYNDRSKCHRYLASACAEGIFFITIFAIIFYFRAKNKFEAFIHANELISRDETLHRDFYCAKIKTMSSNERLTQEEAYELVSQAVEIEKKFVDLLLEKPIDSKELDEKSEITDKNLKLYVEMLADAVLINSGYSPKYNSKVDLPWMMEINMMKKSNFYEKKVADYKVTDLPKALDYESRLRASEDDETEVEEDDI